MLRSILVIGAAVGMAFAQQPPISNADLKRVSAAGGLEAAIKAATGAGPGWIGYAVPAAPGGGNYNCGSGLQTAGPVRLEGPSHLVVLLRYEAGVASKLRVLSPDCPLDAGGLPFHWLTEVKPAESVAMLLGWVPRKADLALQAVSLHAAPEAVPAMIRLARGDESQQVRRQAMVWLGRSRDRRALEFLEQVLAK